MATEPVYHYFGERGRANGMLTVAMQASEDGSKLYAGFCMTPVGRDFAKGFAKLMACYRLEFALTGAWPIDEYGPRFDNYTKYRSDLRNACLALEDFGDKAYSVVLELPEDDRDRVGHRLAILQHVCAPGGPLAPSIKKFARELLLESLFAASIVDHVPDDVLKDLAEGKQPGCSCDHEHDEFPS